jgi:hypothetical protein
MKRFLVALLFSLLVSSPSLAQSSPDATTRALFDWYLQAGDDYRNDFSAARPYLTAELYSLLERGFSQSPSDRFWVDFDPFVNAQVPAGRFKFGKPHVTGKSSFVRITPYMNMGEGGSTVPMPDIKVYLKEGNGQWKVANLVYTGENAFELRKYLQDGLASSGDESSSSGGESADTMMSPKEVESEQNGQDLASGLLGTWVHKATSKTPDGAAQPLDIAVIKWTFKPGGKCDFYQKVGSGRPMQANNRSYTLEGQTITLGSRTKYTVVKNLGNKMIWENHRLGDFYHVVKE